MILDEAIKHYEEVAEELEEEAVKGCCDDTEIMNKCIEGANEHRQLAEWLKELKRLREQTRWIPVSERLPEDNIHVLCQFYLGGMGECYLAHGAFHVVGGLVMTCNEVIAWMPLPEPYEAESEE